MTSHVLHELSKTERKRVAVFASCSSDSSLPPQVLPYLAGLKPLTSAIVVVCDYELAPGEREKLASFTDHVIIGRHAEYDFGSYKRGTLWARKNGLLEDADDLILCNDSCYGPVASFEPMFQAMDAHRPDFWGATDSHQYTYHLQSYWMVLSRPVFSSHEFQNFIEGVKKGEDVQKDYDLGLTKILLDSGFKHSVMVENTLKGVHSEESTYNDITRFPLFTLERLLPLIKVEALRDPQATIDGQNQVLTWLRDNKKELYGNVISDIDIRRFEDADDVAFSLIMPTRNRAWCISRAILSVLAQTHNNFELIIIDDGSTDDTKNIVHQNFEKELANGRIRYIQLSENVGVCNARNIGLAYARNHWIGYIDSDNSLRPYYLTKLANTIIDNPDEDTFYGQIINVGTGRVVGKKFDRNALLEANFIDLGVLIHRKSLVARFGGFDPDLKRLVDWDLIIRFTKEKPAIFVPIVFLDYTDREIEDRISKKESFIGAKLAIHTKYSVKPTVSTAIVCYNHEDFLVEAIESALEQQGNFSHEILISDDGSTDNTKSIINHYIKKYPGKIRDISRGGNFGISSNYKHCFGQATGKYVAILEGDDYWTDKSKNFKQAMFLEENHDAAMVFSMIEIFNTQNNSHSLLERQVNLPPLLTAQDFVVDDSLNLIVNLSCSMYVRRIMTEVMPSSVYLPRLSEIILPIYFDRIGKKIGFINEVMSIYRQNPFSVWTGASKISQLEQAIAIRENALDIARDEYKPRIQWCLDDKKRQLAKLQSAETASSKAA